MSAPTVVVTGAAGFLGGHLCRTLVARGWTVRALVRNPDAAAVPPAVRVGRLDLPDVIDETSSPAPTRSCTAAWADPRDRSGARRASERRGHAAPARSVAACRREDVRLRVERRGRAGCAEPLRADEGRGREAPRPRARSRRPPGHDPRARRRRHLRAHARPHAEAPRRPALRRRPAAAADGARRRRLRGDRACDRARRHRRDQRRRARPRSLPRRAAPDGGARRAFVASSSRCRSRRCSPWCARWSAWRCRRRSAARACSACRAFVRCRSTTTSAGSICARARSARAWPNILSQPADLSGHRKTGMGCSVARQGGAASRCKTTEERAFSKRKDGSVCPRWTTPAHEHRDPAAAAAPGPSVCARRLGTDDRALGRRARDHTARLVRVRPRGPAVRGGRHRRDLSAVRSDQRVDVSAVCAVGGGAARSRLRAGRAYALCATSAFGGRTELACWLVGAAIGATARAMARCDGPRRGEHAVHDERDSRSSERIAGNDPGRGRRSHCGAALTSLRACCWRSS